jgi:flagellar capping protein FliD
MATTSSVGTTSTANLDAYFVQQINNIIALDKQPVEKLKYQKDDITVQKGVYTDLKAQLDGFHTQVKALWSTQSTYALGSTLKSSITGAPSGSTVLSATASTGALAGNYAVNVTQLARYDRKLGDQMFASDQMLGISGSFYMGGAADRSASVAASDPAVASVTTSSIGEGQSELGSNSYYIETHQDNGTWKFRLVDGEGKAISIKQSDGTYGTGWQTMAAGDYDTGRGLKLNFNAVPPSQAQTRSSGAQAISYTAKGAEITVSGSQSLVDIATAINSATYADGNEVQASVVDNRLVLQSKYSGSAHVVTAAEKDGGMALNVLGILNGSNYKNYAAADHGQNAIFSVNNITINRSQNTSLTDVVSGLTLNLASDAEGKSATINVTGDYSGGRGAINSFISKYNELQTYLKAKTAVTVNDDKTYTRGPLAGETIYKSLSSELFSSLTRDATNTGTLKNLREIGITLDDNLNATVSDSAKLDAALQKDPANVKLLMDTIMSRFDLKIGMYTGTNGYVQRSMNTATDRMKSIDDRVTMMNDRIEKRRQSLITQYGSMQATLYSLQYTQSTLRSLGLNTSS